MSNYLTLMKLLTDQILFLEKEEKLHIYPDLITNYKELLFIKDEYGNTILHHNIDKYIILKAIEVGGCELLMIKNKDEETILQAQYDNDILVKSIEIGGNELLIMNDIYNKKNLESDMEIISIRIFKIGDNGIWTIKDEIYYQKNDDEYYKDCYYYGNR